MSDPSTRLERAIEQLGAEHEPPPGWQGRVLAAVAPKPRSRRWWFAFPALAAVVVGVVVLARWPRPERLSLTAELAPWPQLVRGGSGQIRAVVRGGDGHRAIWIYRDRRELVAVCPGHAACRSAPDGLRVDLAAERIGSYQIVAVSSAEALPAPTGSYDVDLAAALDAGAACEHAQLELQ